MQLKSLLLRYVAYTISDSKTWWNFSQVSRFCWALNKEYTALKKRELSNVLLRDSNRYVDHIRYLPGNGYLHGIQKCIKNDGTLFREDYFLDGYLIHRSFLHIPYSSHVFLTQKCAAYLEEENLWDDDVSPNQRVSIVRITLVLFKCLLSGTNYIKPYSRYVTLKLQFIRTSMGKTSLFSLQTCVKGE